MARSGWLLLLLAMWLLPLRTAQADLGSMLQRGSPCQPASLLLLSHVGGGFVSPLWRSPPTLAARSTQYAVEVETALGCALRGFERPGPVIYPELGYSLTLAPADELQSTSTHLAKIGASAGYGFAWASVSYGARLLIGARGPELAAGLRHGLTGRFLYNVVAVDVAHQFLAVGDVLEQDVRVTASVNIFLFLLAVGYMH